MGQKELNSDAFATRASADLTERSTAVVALQSYSKLKEGGWSFVPPYQPIIGLGCLGEGPVTLSNLTSANGSVQGGAQLGAISRHECFGPEGGPGGCAGTATAAPL